MRSVVVAFSVVVVGAGCAQEAPAGMDNLSRFVFDRVEPAEGLDAAAQETELRDAIGRLREEFAEQQVTDGVPFTGLLEDLDEENVEGLEGVSERIDLLQLAQGFALANVTPCTQQHMANLLTSNRSSELHPEVYETYAKTFDGDEAAFRNGDSDFLTWTTSYKILQPPVGSAYSADLRVMGRRVRAADGEGDILLTKLFLPQPAVFDGEGSSFELDFQMEIWFDDGDGQQGHFYGMWRRMVLGPVDSSNGLFIDQTLSGFVEFEDRVGVACNEGKLNE
jgi:hypothetical protein